MTIEIVAIGFACHPTVNRKVAASLSHDSIVACDVDPERLVAEFQAAPDRDTVLESSNRIRTVHLIF